MLAQAADTGQTLGPASARQVRDQADELERRRERTALRGAHVNEQIAWRRKR